jgi:hypothetical protein
MNLAIFEEVRSITGTPAFVNLVNKALTSSSVGAALPAFFSARAAFPI